MDIGPKIHISAAIIAHIVIVLTDSFLMIIYFLSYFAVFESSHTLVSHFFRFPQAFFLSLLIVAQATVVNIFPVIVADTPDSNANSPSFVKRARPAPSEYLPLD